VLKKKPKKGSKNTKPITKIENCESFFSFFSPPQVPDDEEEIDEDTVSSFSCICLLLYLKLEHGHDSSHFYRLSSCRTKWSKITILGMHIILYAVPQN
jgi:hypothetical protein